MRLPIRVRRIVQGNADSRRALIVYCPEARSSRPLDDCHTCERSEGVSIGLDPDERAVLCQVDAKTPLPVRRVVLPTEADLTNVGELLTREVICVAAGTALATAAAALVARGIGAAPVVGDDDRPIGVITREGLLRALIEPEPPRTVDPVLEPLRYVLAEGGSVAGAAAIMAAERLEELVVVGDYGRVVGLLTALDVTRWLARRAGFDGNPK